MWGREMSCPLNMSQNRPPTDSGLPKRSCRPRLGAPRPGQEQSLTHFPACAGAGTPRHRETADRRDFRPESVGGREH